jgi:hypothetical protein
MENDDLFERNEVEGHDETPPEWLDSAATACSFMVGSASRYGEDAEGACALLRDAGIPSQVVVEHQEEGPDLLCVMVPGSLSLKATSVLDLELFNPESEEIWRTHFAELSDDELRALSAEDLCAGLLDRAERLKRAYEEALASREANEPSP